MRVWDFDVKYLCDIHLRAQHREIHSIRTVIVEDRKGFSHHPEVMRWRGHLGDLLKAHDKTVREMVRRGMKHHTPFGNCGQAFLPCEMRAPAPWQPLDKQVVVLYAKSRGGGVKGCTCHLPAFTRFEAGDSGDLEV